MGKIVRLDPVVASQIAAGEVVESSASVVKELAENSLDAGATRVIVEFEDSGLTLVRVTDDGCGMEKDDAKSCLERFTTSKLRVIDDLGELSTLGFRGEALPSIASCSKVTLKTKPENADVGTVVEAEGGKIKNVFEEGLPSGTSVTVENLFYNTPARLEFVRSRTRERQTLIETVERLAFSHPHIAFTLMSSGKTILNTAGLGLKNAITDVYGPEVGSSLLEVNGTLREGLKVKGFVGSPSIYRSRRDRQIFSVNSRPVRNSVLGWALDDAFSGLLPPKAYPFAVLNVEIPKDEVDVNVHPAKAEIRFKNERSVRAALTQAVRSALKDAGLHVGFDAPYGERAFPGYSGKGRGQSGDPGSFFPQTMVRDLENLLSGGRRENGEKCPPGWAFLGSLFDTYLVASTPESLMVIDKHAFMEAQVYRELLLKRSGKQELLMGEMVTLDSRGADLYENVRPGLEELGFSARFVGHKTLMVTGVPLVLGQPVNPESVKDVVSLTLSEGSKGESPERTLESLRIATAACHASVRARETLHEDEACKMLWDVYSNPELRTCPHGRPTLKEMSYKDINKFFGRTSHTASQEV